MLLIEKKDVTGMRQSGVKNTKKATALIRLSETLRYSMFRHSGTEKVYRV